MAKLGNRSDPINENYYCYAEFIEKLVFGLFVVGGVFSIALLFTQDQKYHDLMQSGFLCVSLLLFFLNHFFHLSLFPKAENKRVSDFIDSAYDTNLSGRDKTEGYYNNAETSHMRRIAFQCLENTFFTKEISSLMLKAIRPISSIYFLVWLPCVIYRGSDLDWLVVFSSVLFSEEVFSKWIKLEWLKHKSVSFYDDIHRMIQTCKDEAFAPATIEKCLMYEKLKATTSILLCSKIFKQNNKRLANEWDRIRQSLENDRRQP